MKTFHQYDHDLDDDPPPWNPDANYGCEIAIVLMLVLGVGFVAWLFI